MRDPIAIGLVTGLGVLVLLPILLWFVLAAFITGSGCLWVMGIGGCVPGTPHAGTGWDLWWLSDLRERLPGLLFAVSGALGVVTVWLWPEGFASARVACHLTRWTDSQDAR
jgi:hypothetical protein